MEPTRSSLLLRIRDPRDSTSWSQFHKLYEPFLLRVLARQHVPQQDACEIVQDVFVKILANVQKFKYEKSKGRFRGWLKTVTINALHDRQRQKMRQYVVQLEDIHHEPATYDQLEQCWETEYQRRILEHVLAEVKVDSNQVTWACFHEHVVRRRPAADVALELGLSKSAVYVNSHRVMERVKRICVEQYDERLTDD